MNDRAASSSSAASPSPLLTNRRITLAAVALSLLGAGCGAAGPDANAVSLETARAEHEAGRAVLIDIREPEEHATGVAAGAKLLPMSRLADRIGEVPTDPTRPVLLICHTQSRSGATVKNLRKRGFNHVKYVDGGMSEWARRGWPMVKPRL